MTALSWFTAGRATARQVCRSSVMIAAGAGYAAVWAVSSGGGYTHAPSAALVTLAAAHNPAAHAAASVLGLTVPLTAMVGTFVGQQSLFRHRRALLAASPDATWTRAAYWFAVVLGLAVGTTLLGSSLPAAAELLIDPMGAVLWLVPAAMAISGLQALVGEITRQPLAGLVVGALWLMVSFGAEHLATLRFPRPVAVLMVTPATVYPLGGALLAVNLFTGGLGLLLWAAAAAGAHYYRRQGWDV